MRYSVTVKSHRPEKLWPAFVFLGVVLAFMLAIPLSIAAYLLFLIFS